MALIPKGELEKLQKEAEKLNKKLKNELSAFYPSKSEKASGSNSDANDKPLKNLRKNE